MTLKYKNKSFSFGDEKRIVRKPVYLERNSKTFVVSP